MRGRESAAPAFLPSGKGHGGAAPVSRNGPRRFCRLSSPIRHYFPDCWAVNWSAAGAAHGNCTPPRISSSCPHLLRWTTAETASTLDFMAGQEYRPHRRSWPHTEPPCADSRFSRSLPAEAKRRQEINMRCGLVVSSGRSWRSC